MDRCFKEDEYYMNAALDEARKSLSGGDVPVGAVIVGPDGKIIARAFNCRESRNDSCAHAELSCISAASKTLGRWRLSDCVMYVTLEPCPMCAGAILNARIPKVVVAARNSKSGALGSVVDLNSYPLNIKTEVVFDVCRDESLDLLKLFFKDKRED